MRWVFVSRPVSQGSAKIKLFQVPSLSVLHVWVLRRLFHSSGITFWPVSGRTEAHFLSRLPWNEKQRAALSSAGNNAALGPHGPLIGSLLYIQTFDPHQHMYNSITTVVFYLRWETLNARCVFVSVCSLAYLGKWLQHCGCLYDD